MAGARSRDPWGASGICYLFGSLLVELLFSRAVAFNLDVMGALRKEGEPSSLFGFSVALHRQLQPRPQSWQRVDQILETRDMIGRCFVLSQDLAIRDELDGGEWKFCEGRPQGHEQFGFCQQGTAAAFSPDNHYLLFGAPGTYNWKGESLFGKGRRGPKPSLTSETGLGTCGGLPGPVGRKITLPPGFSIDSGKGLVRAEELSFVAGAPRANHKGAVVILRKDSASRLVPEVLLSGERLTSGFGYSLAVADLNSDGWPDLIVGAPYFFERQEELGGAVYVYLNQGGHWAGISPLRLCGSPDSMFGISLAVLGDLNQDGFPDIAVGAPFDGDGKVFIYHGSSLGVVAKPSQVLEGEAVGIKSFGYSLSGSLDMDGNQYPDLLVGSLADTAVLFRARPILHVSHEVSIAPRSIDLEQPNCAGGHSVCVDLRVCFSYIAVPSSYSPTVALDYVLDADTDRRLRGQVPRVMFLSRNPEEPKHQASGTVWLKHQHDRVCGDAMFQLQENVKDKLRAIVVTLSYSLQTPRLRRHAPGQGLPPVAPILNAHQPSTQRAEIHFLKQGCGEDKICQSNLQLVRARFCTRVSDTEFQPLPMDADGTTALFALSGQPVIGLELMVTNLPSDPAQPQADGDDAHEAQLLVMLPDSLHYSGVRALDPAVPVPDAHTCPCPLTRISEQELHPVSARARVFIELPLSIAGMAIPQQLFFSGVVRGERAMQSERDVGSKVKYEVTVSNQGQSLKTLGSAFLNIMWPHEIANGKWLLYPMRVELEGGQGPGQKGLCSPRPNILHLVSRDRRRRELEPPEQQEPGEQQEPSMSWWPVSSAEKKKNITLDCARGTANCVVFSCPLYSFDRAAVLHVWGRLWNSTFLEVRIPLGVGRNLESGPDAPPSRPSFRGQGGYPWSCLLDALLVSLTMGFFKRAKHPEATVPQYHAVKIPREDRQQFKEEKTGTILRNNWGSPRREGPDAHPILAADGHPELGPDGHPGPGTA
uniref:Integrin subunit alpha 7 n=1 Tax=Nomascus leucogenys TaxID=61853 RepID=A0A2I3G0E5_NOMLE